MIDSERFYGWWELPIDTVERCAKAADEMTRRARVSSFRRMDNTDSVRAHFIGNCGEAVFALVRGWPEPDFLKKATGKTDGGEDFPGLDIKTTTHSPPSLNVWADKRFGSRFTRAAKVRWFVLIEYDDTKRRGRICGYATRAEVFAAPVVSLGGHDAFSIPESKLHKPDPTARQP
jgi:hypothetical protein